MGFTGQLGTALSSLGNVELGVVGGGGGGGGGTPTPTYAREIVFGPPIQGAPWTRRRPYEAGLIVLAPAPLPPPRYAPEIVLGPPMTGAPWNRVRPYEAALLVITPPPRPPTPTYAPELVFGPPLRGAPWRTRLLPVEGFGLVGAPAGAANVLPPVYAPEVSFGPPLRGAPWLHRIPVLLAGNLLGKVILPGNPGGPSVKAAALPFLPRVPADGDPRRLARLTEQLANILNALIRAGILVQTGPETWTVKAANLS